MCYDATVFEGKANNTLDFPYQIHWKCAQFDPPIYLFITLKVASSVYTENLQVPNVMETLNIASDGV